MTITERHGPDAGRPPLLLAAATLIVAVGGILLAFVALMALFLGAEGRGLQALLALIGWMIPPAVALTVLSAMRIPDAGQGRLAACWARLPAWLVILISLLIVLALLAELAIWLVEFTGGDAVSLGHYVPIVAVLVFAAAFTTGYSLIAPVGADGDHRGPVRHSDPVRRDLD